MKTVELKNGVEEVQETVDVLMLSLIELQKTNPIALYELYSLCKDPEHKLFGKTGELLESLSLVNNGSVHTSTKNIVLSAIEGEGLEMRIMSPIWEGAEELKVVLKDTDDLWLSEKYD